MLVVSKNPDIITSVSHCNQSAFSFLSRESHVLVKEVSRKADSGFWAP